MAGDRAHQDLIDPFGRHIKDLRISITDRCNFRCTYCMPEDGLEWLDRSQVMSFEEMEHLARIFVERYGVQGIRLTGGEPTVRAHLPALVRKLAKLEHSGGPIDLSMTTNGATLRSMAPRLRKAGLKRVNISLDTLDREKFHRMTRRDELDNVLDGIAAAQEAGFRPVKINAVIERGVNDDEIVDLAEFGRERNVEVRFIEFMPLDADGHWVNDTVVGQDEMVEMINAVYPIEVMPARGAAPADRFRYLDRDPSEPGGKIGIIPTVTKPFCGDCDRVRLTSDGDFRTCLFATKEFDLLTALRAGETDDQIAARIEAAVATKWAGHKINQVSFTRPTKSMSQIGG
ncbi:GTP 3',8-cyclase MoaA [Ilumatobacter nonamiensis]|uniref:GTP 3',8-cyclase MoaA n=1 Tax=Ilumatobacter nonamiensis TaxID=467093 RepID=UPI0003491056|nr:GTP 3',8-cyclase MoaA [Ilumatobacter nonamiensis]